MPIMGIFAVIMMIYNSYIVHHVYNGYKLIGKLYVFHTSYVGSIPTIHKYILLIKLV